MEQLEATIEGTVFRNQENGYSVLTVRSGRSEVTVIGSLPDKYKQVILLYYYSNLTLQETADALGIPKSTANKRLRKAEEILKHSLTGGDMG